MTCAAVSASTWVKPHGKSIVAFALAWSSPKVKFNKGCTYNRRYTKFYGTSERSSVDLVHHALMKYKSWEEEIERWQNPILKNAELPEWYKFTLFNELYFLVAGRTVWTGLGAAWKVADISAGSSVVIFGLGTVGLAVAQGAKLRGASEVIGVDTNPQKYEKGKSFGVTKYVNPDECSEPLSQVIKKLTNGGADYSFECIGDTEMVSCALQSCCDGWGLTVTLGVPKVKPVVSAHYALFLCGRTLKGSLFGGWKPKSELPLLVDKYLKKVCFSRMN